MYSITMQEELKTYKIGEVASLLNLQTYVLRFWETEFSQIAPLRTAKGQRLYTEKDVEILRHIQFLLHEQGMTIEGARRQLSTDESLDAVAAEAPLATPPAVEATDNPATGISDLYKHTALTQQVLKQVKRELESVADFLRNSPKAQLK